MCQEVAKGWGIFRICHQKPLEATEIINHMLLTYIVTLSKGDYFRISSRKCSIRMSGNKEVLGRPSIAVFCDQIYELYNILNGIQLQNLKGNKMHIYSCHKHFEVTILCFVGSKEMNLYSLLDMIP